MADGPTIKGPDELYKFVNDYFMQNQKHNLTKEEFYQWLASYETKDLQRLSELEIKLNNSEKVKRWEWEGIQARIFRIRIKSLTLTQYQRIGSVLINDSKNILISLIAAKAVLDAEITLGIMFAIQYIVGFMNSPIDQLIGFVHSAQDAKISLERLGEVHIFPLALLWFCVSSKPLL